MGGRTVFRESRGVLKIVAAGLLAGASAGCSSDSSRFGDNPFTNPFSAASTARTDGVSTGSTPNRSAAVGAVSAQPLPPALPRASSPPRVATASLAALPPSPVEGSASGWTAAGGTPVTVGAGETASTLSARYGVPAAAISAANGGTIRSGQQAIIPIYTGTARAASSAPQIASRPGAMPEIMPDSTPRPSPGAAASEARAKPPAVAAATPRPVASIPAAPKASDSQRRILAAAPKAPNLGQAAAKPAKSVNALKPADDDDEDEAPRKVAQAQPSASSRAKPEQGKPEQTKPEQTKPELSRPVQVRTEQNKPEQAAPAARPQPRVIPLGAQSSKKEDAPPVRTAQAPQADPTTTQSIPPVKAPQQVAAAPAVAAPPAEERAEFRWPARGRVISGFGSKGGNGDGIAIAVPEGTPVKAASDGVVAYAGEELKGYGKLVLVRHDNGYVSAYAHNGELNVKRGEKVSRGQTIAKSGATGNVTSPQLHFELRKGSTPVDPTKLLEN